MKGYGDYMEIKTVPLGNSDIAVPAIAVGCMQIAKMEKNNLAKHLNYCIENGLNFFDHADIYGAGECEKAFSHAIKETGFGREDIILQSKCGIRKGMYDFSREHILSAVDGILTRLDTDYLDMLVLHRPDALAQPEEVAEVFDALQSSGKVKNFGVSNHRPMQIELLKQYVKQPILVNQLRFGVTFSTMISSGIEANMTTNGAVDRDGDVLDYCRLNKITIQTWSPFLHGLDKKPFIGDRDSFAELNDLLDELSLKYNATPTAIATAWVLRHPANMQLIAGTTNTQRMAEIVNGSKITLTREDWYKIYIASGHILP